MFGICVKNIRINVLFELCKFYDGTHLLNGMSLSFQSNDEIAVGDAGIISQHTQGVQRRMVLVVNFLVFLKLLFFTLLLIRVT